MIYVKVKIAYKLTKHKNFQINIDNYENLNVWFLMIFILKRNKNIVIKLKPTTDCLVDERYRWQMSIWNCL